MIPSTSPLATRWPARTGERTHLDQIRLIVRSVSCKIEVGGGVRTADAAFELLEAGVVARVKTTRDKPETAVASA